jgi:hypothetical protein
MPEFTEHKLTRKTGYNLIPQEISYLIADEIAPRTAERVVKYCEDIASNGFSLTLHSHKCEVKKAYPLAKRGRHSKLHTVTFRQAGGGKVIFHNVLTENGGVLGHAYIDMETPR